MDERGPEVRFEGVTKRFGALAVDGVDCTIAPGSFVALVGGSGAGKSTLLRMVNRLIEPDAGRITIGGRDVGEGPAPLMRRLIGYVFPSQTLPSLELSVFNPDRRQRALDKRFNLNLGGAAIFNAS